MTLIVVLMTCILGNGAAMADMFDVIHKINPYLKDEQVDSYVRDIHHYATVNGLDPKLVAAVIAKESSFRRKAVGGLGEVGLMQLRPEYHATHLPTLADRTSYLADPTNNIGTGVRYLAAICGVYAPRFKGVEWVEMYNRGPFAKQPRKFPYAKAVGKFYAMFKGDTNARHQNPAIQLSQRESRQD